MNSAKKLVVIYDWCFENIEDYHRPNLSVMAKLIEKLEEVE